MARKDTLDMLRISINRTCGTLSGDAIRVIIQDKDFNYIFEGEMSMKDYARLITGENCIPIKDISEREIYG